MKRLNIKDLEVGMVLSDQVKGSQNQVLLNKGAQLTEKHIRILKIWGISNISIKSTDADETETETGSHKLREAAKLELLPIFQHSDLKNPIIAALFKASVNKLALSLTGKDLTNAS